MRGNRTIVALMLALMLVVPSLDCAGYGVLLHTRVVEPPELNIHIGHLQLIGAVFPPSPCLPAQPCQQPGTALPHPFPLYSVCLFINDVEPYHASHVIRLVQLPLHEYPSGGDCLAPAHPAA